MFAQPRKRKTPSQAHGSSSPSISATSPSTSAAAATPVEYHETQENVHQETPAQSSTSTSGYSNSSPRFSSTAPTHSESLQWPCRVCKVPLSSPSNRKRHERAKHPDSVYAQTDGRFRKRIVESDEQSEEMSPDAKRPCSRLSSNLVSDTEDEIQADKQTVRNPQPVLIAVKEAAAQVGQDHTGSSASSPLVIDSSGSSSSESSEADLSPSESDESSCEEVAASCTAKKRATNQNKPAPVKWNFQELSTLPNAPVLLSVEAFQSECEPFFTWLTQPPITQCEALVKARRVRSISQLLPMQNNLRFLFVTLNECKLSTKSVDSEDGTADEPITLKAFADLHICQELFNLLVSRQVGSARIYALFLLIKKVLVFLSSVNSLKQKQYLTPASFSSFFYVDSVCSDAGLQRKQESRNRSLLGMQARPFQGSHSSASLLTASAASSFPRQQDSSRSLSRPNHQENARVASEPRAAANAANAAVSRRTPPSSTNLAVDGICKVATLTKDDLQRVASGSLKELAHLQTVLSSPLDGHGRQAQKQHQDLCKRYVQFLATATLCLGLAPRSQVLQQLRIGSTLVKEKGQYWVRLLAELNKNAKPCMMVFPPELTVPFDFYLETVRPNLLKGQQHDYVFFKRDGKAPRPEFSSYTTAVTKELLGRPINAHAFRSGVITTFYENGATQSEMDVLANLMAHDAATAKTHYFRPQFAKAAVQTNLQMTKILLPSAARSGHNQASARPEFARNTESHPMDISA